MYTIKGFSTKKDIKKQFVDNGVPLVTAFDFVDAKCDDDTLEGLEIFDKKGKKQKIKRRRKGIVSKIKDLIN